MTDRDTRIEDSIAALQAQRALLGDTVVDTAVAALRRQLQAGAEQQLRRVTVLFADVVGSTAFNSGLDPETTHQVMDGALARLSAQVQAHGGVVLQYAGDSLLAAFGTAGAREDDAERAVLAGLALLAEARRLAAELRSRQGLAGFSLRVGVHTGPVLLGGGVDGAGTIRGSTVNIAARMEQTAPVGRLRISHDTWRQVRGLFEMAAQPPLQVKGQSLPLHTYLVVRARPRSERRAQRGVDGLDDSPLVGREAELAALQAACEHVRAGGPAPLVVLTLLGEAGIGKSRLAAEFQRWLAQHQGLTDWLQAQAGERDSGQPYGLLRALFQRWLHILDSDAPPVARRKWLDGMVPLLRSTEDAAVLGHLLGLDFSAQPGLAGLLADARQLRDRGFFHAGQALRGMAAPGEPLLVLLDDLHWADDATLDFLDHLQTQLADLPLLLIGLARPTLDERRPPPARALPVQRRLRLQPLDATQSAALAQALLRRLPAAPAALRQAIGEGGAGNPFYMEELVNMLIDQGMIRVGAGGWQLQAETLPDLALPGTLAGVLQARLDALPPDELHLLQLAAVVGPVFWDAALRALGVRELAPLQALQRRELVLVRPGSSLAGRLEYAFRHHALQQAAYERLLKRLKQPAHAQVARWLEAQPGAAPDGVAAHYERGGEPGQARRHWQRAAEAALERHALAETLRHADHALALLAPDDAQARWPLQYLKVRALDFLSAHEALDAALRELQALADASGRPEHRARVLERRARWHYEAGDAQSALQAAEAAMASGADAECTVLADAMRVFALGRLGRHAEARSTAAQALGRARAAGLIRVEAMILNEIGNYLADEGDYGAAIVQLEAALARHRELGDRLNEGGTLANLAFVAMALGDYARAQQQFRQAMALSAAVGQRKNEGLIHVNLGLVLLNQGQAAEAHGHALQALDLLRATGNRWGEAAALRVAGQAAWALGRRAEAAEGFSASKAVFDQLGMPHLAIEAMAQQAALALDEGRLPQALAEVQALLQRLADGAGLEGTDEPLRIRLACWQVLQAAADPRADAQLALAWQELNERAGRIADPARRQAFVQAVPFHREIAAAWARRQAPAGAGEAAVTGS